MEWKLEGIGKMIKVDTINRIIISGLNKAWLTNFFLIGERDSNIKPEYLTTASICIAFCDYIEKETISGSFVVRAEEKTKTIWRKAQLLKFFLRKKKGYRSSDKSKDEFNLIKNSERNGNVDISLYRNTQGLETAFGVIENKGFLRFTKEGGLDSGSRKELEKDLKRNIEFLSQSLEQAEIEYSAFTFYLRDTESTLKSEGDDYRQKKKKYFEGEVIKLLDSSGNLYFEVNIDTLDSNFCDSSNQTVDDDCFEGIWHILYGLIIIHKVNN